LKRSKNKYGDQRRKRRDRKNLMKGGRKPIRQRREKMCGLKECDIRREKVSTKVRVVALVSFFMARIA